MEHQDNDHAGNETKDFSDEFQCCVCLDLFYKPVVLACGHIACFWCVFRAMDTWQESHCPVCRHPYNHFPSICRLLHFMLLNLYPLAYNRRERQVIEEEKKFGSFSPQFDEYLSESHSSKEFDILGSSSLHSTTNSHSKLDLESSSMVEGDPLFIQDASETIAPDKHYTTTSPTSSGNEATRNVAAQESSKLGNVLVHETRKEVLITDLLCASCKQLLYCPVVLNCGHVYCEACIINPNNKFRCEVCGSVHPNGFPKVCLVLEHFLEKQFPEECAARKEALLKLADHQYGSPSTCSTQDQQHGAQCSSLPINDYSLWWRSGQGPKVHFGVGCDYCGMCPIIGERYKCKDCVEKMGFDLCEGCYNCSSKLPGRFNQQHTPEHEFEIAQPPVWDNLIWGLEAEHSEDVSRDLMNLEVVFPTPDSSSDAQLNTEAGPAAPIFSNDTSENQESTDSTT